MTTHRDDSGSVGMAADGSANGFRPVKSADRTLDVLEVLATSSQERQTLGSLSRTLGIPKSSLHGILRTMERRGWVESDDTGVRFGLGLRALLVGASYIDTDPDVAAAQAALDRLAEQTGETVHLGRLEHANVVYLAKRESTHPLRLFSAIGRRLPAHATALGKSLLAEHSDEEVDRILSWPVVSLTQHTLVERERLLDELRETRARGFAIDNQENTLGVRCFAAPVLRAGRRPQDAVSVSVPMARLHDSDVDRLGELVRDAAAEITAARHR